MINNTYSRKLMKRIVILFSMMLVFMTASAQQYWDSSRPDHRFTFGVRAGFNLSKLIEENLEWRYRMGYQAGVSVDVNLVRSLSICTGVTYIKKGFKMELEYGPTFTMEYDYKPAYIEIPLALSYRIKLSDSSQFQLNGGGYYSFGLKGSDENYFTDTMKKEDLGVILGAAVTYSHYYFGANYERSLKSLSKTDDKSYNSSIVISLGYNF